MQNIFITNLLGLIDISYCLKLFARYRVEKLEGTNKITHT